MRDVLRAEFPGFNASLVRLRLPAVAREPWWWAVVSALGAGFIAQAIVRIALMAIFPALFPATEPHPEWITPAAIADIAGGIAAGAVALRAGGIAAVVAYVAYELLRLLAALPGTALFCERSGGPLGLANSGLPVRGCDYPSLVMEHWPVWLVIAIGALAARVLPTRIGDGNWLLRGAGAFIAIGTVLGTALGLVATYSAAPPNTLLLNAIFAVIDVVAGVVAGALLARARLPGAVLVAVLAAGPTLAFSLPLALRGGFASEPPEFAVTRWEAVLIPLLAAAAMLASRWYVRTKGNLLVARL